MESSTKIPTAEEFLKFTENAQKFSFTFPHRIVNMMKEFTKFHVEAALKEGNNKVKVRTFADGNEEYIVDRKDSILTSYLLENIK